MSNIGKYYRSKEQHERLAQKILSPLEGQELPPEMENFVKVVDNAECPFPFDPDDCDGSCGSICDGSCHDLESGYYEN